MTEFSTLQVCICGLLIRSDRMACSCLHATCSLWYRNFYQEILAIEAQSVQTMSPLPSLCDAAQLYVSVQDGIGPSLVGGASGRKRHHQR